jgi:hypothetical protein
MFGLDQIRIAAASPDREILAMKTIDWKQTAGCGDGEQQLGMKSVGLF